MDVKTSNESGPKLQFNRLTLAFKGAQSHFEPIFLDYYFHNTLRQIRIAILVGIFFYGAFSTLDLLILPDRYTLFWAIRWGAVCPCLVGVYIASHTRFAYRHMQLILSFGTLVGGFGIIAMVQLASPELSHSYVGGLVQIIFFVFTFGRLRFVWGSGVACTLVAAYLVITMAVGTAPRNLIIGKTFHLSFICLMGMMAGYAIEYRTRKNFFLSRQLESKKRRLTVANDYLEERVAKRTAELKQTNALLKDEIGERKLIESALRDSQKRFQRMVNNVTDHMCVYNLDGKILEANRQMISGLGYPFEILSEMNYQDLIVPDERAGFYQYLTEIRRKGTATGAITLLTRKGESCYFEYSNVLAEHTDGHQAIFSLTRDITDRKISEKALADSQMRFQNIFETAAAGMAIISGKTRTVVEINRAGIQMMGRRTGQIRGAHLDQLITMPKGSEHQHLPVPAPHPIECFLGTEEGHFLPILASTEKTEFNEQPHWIVSFVNIQKIKEAEAIQRELEVRSNRAQHLESIGTLAGGVAHDFNNILFGIMGFAELALEDADPDSLQANNLKEILKGGFRAKEMIAQILTFSRQENIEKSVVHPGLLIKEALKLLRASLPSSIEIVHRFAPKLSDIEVNPTHLHQVIMNLCTNAAHALSDSQGRIDVIVDNTTIDEDRLTSHGELSQGDYVRLVVKDNGEGIPAEIIGRIFEPFYTTKSQGQGSGMGLAVVLGIVQSHNGSIHVDTGPGQGTCFEVLFPAANAESPKAYPAQGTLPNGTEQVLVVDDERPLLILMNRMLSSLGYQVTTCNGSEEALALFRGRPGYFDLLITDLTMPKKSGTALAQEVMQVQPDLPVILITGYGDKLSQDETRKIGISDVLIKPVLKKDLAIAIRQVLDTDRTDLPDLKIHDGLSRTAAGAK